MQASPYIQDATICIKVYEVRNVFIKLQTAFISNELVDKHSLFMNTVLKGLATLHK